MNAKTAADYKRITGFDFSAYEDAPLVSITRGKMTVTAGRTSEEYDLSRPHAEIQASLKPKKLETPKEPPKVNRVRNKKTV